MTTANRLCALLAIVCRPRSVFIMFVGLAIAISLPGCGETTASVPASGAASPDRPDESSGSGRVYLEESQLTQVHIEELSTRPPADFIKLTATIEFNADRMAKLLPPVSGQVRNLIVNVGDVVRKNDVVFTLNSREVAAAVADHVASRKDLELAEKTFAMTQDLFEHQAASRMALQQSENELAKARSRVIQTEEGLKVLGLDAHGDNEPPPSGQSQIPVRAPIDGVVIERNVTNGQFVGAENPALITIADLSSVWLQGDIFERDLRHIATGQYADVTTAAYPADRFSARVSRISSIVDSQTRTAKVRFLVANPDGRLKPGMFASIALYVSESTASLTVPTKAVFVENGHTFAYVKVGAREFARREIEAVKSGPDRLRVTRGMKAGDRVVSDGVLLLRKLESDSESE